MESITVEQVATKIDLRLNKSASQDYDAIWMDVKEEAYNKATLEWVRRQIRGKNQTQEGDEESQSRVDDLQVLLKEEVLFGKMKKDFYETEKLPSNYLYFKRLTPVVTKGECKDLKITSHPEEEANVDILSHPIPSFKFEETFHTTMGNRFHIYHMDEFIVNKANLVYYELPKYVKFDRRYLNKTLQFKKDVCEMIIDEAVKILASDIESVNQKTLAQERVETNT
jgi:hypothetical protein